LNVVNTLRHMTVISTLIKANQKRTVNNVIKILSANNILVDTIYVYTQIIIIHYSYAIITKPMAFYGYYP